MKPARTAILTLLIFSLVQTCAVAASLSSAESCRLSRRFLLEGKYQQALEAAEQALHLDRNSWEAESVSGQAELALNHLAAAQNHLLRALAFNPRLTEARRALGLTFLKEKKFQEAQRQFKVVLASHSNDFSSLYGSGLSFLLDDQPAKALKPFSKAYQLNGSNTALLAAMLEAYIKLNQGAQASATLSELDRLLANHYRERVQLAALLVSENAYALAAEEFEHLRAANPDSYELSYDLALADYRAGKEAQAGALLEKLLARKDDADLEDLLGDVEEKAQNHAAAATAFHQAMELEPQNEDYRFDYAQSLESHWDLPGALEVFNVGTLDFPSSVRMWLGLGATYYLAGRYREAARSLLQAAKVAPDTQEVYTLLGLAYEAAGPFQEAIANRFSRYLSSDPPDAMAHYYDGKILLERSRQGKVQSLAEARHQLEEAIKLNPRLADAHTELAVLLEMQGEFRVACGELEKAVQFYPESSKAYYNLARVYRKLGEADHAQEALRQFQRLKATQKKNLDQEAVRNFLARAKETGLEERSKRDR